MALKMLIDAQHQEETRVALVDNNKLVEYDFESTTKQTVKSNIYLAKVMRVEPSLQAAFVDYGGNRHGFLAFSEIHPDYFRIPVSDREALAAKLKEAAPDFEDDVLDEEEIGEDSSNETLLNDDNAEDEDTTVNYDMEVSTIAGESIAPIDEETEHSSKRPPLHKMYKIQEVIHKNQILLVQVVKEERGQKGAALTTYLSLAGRYCVLMPNSPQAGGISRKISNIQDRKNLRKILTSLDIPQEMGLIIRTAGQGRTKAEIKRDTDYLRRLWNEIRTETLSSTAPALIYQEDNIIKRAIRDQYSKDVEEILIQGDESYKLAKNFMKKLLPSHTKRVKLYKDEKAPLFIFAKTEHQIEAMHQSTVMLPSGGSIVINPTEALVSIDINSGRATRERHIEETALNTNLEAATEIARQVRLRDLAGLIVIDFIDMYDRRYVGQVERRVREAFKNDRARVQMSKISPFGLLELSRQRLRPSILETSSAPCAHCHATGFVRSVESMSLQILRTLQEEGISNRTSILKALVPNEVAFYLLNQKRNHINDLEITYNMRVEIYGDTTLVTPDFKLIQIESRSGQQTGQPTELTNSQPSSQQKDRNQQKPDQKSQSQSQSQSQKNQGSGKNNNKNGNRAAQPQNQNDETKKTANAQQEQQKDGSKSNSKRRRSNRNRHKNGQQEAHNKQVQDSSETKKQNLVEAESHTPKTQPKPDVESSTTAANPATSIPQDNSEAKAQKEGKPHQRPRRRSRHQRPNNTSQTAVTPDSTPQDPTAKKTAPEATPSKERENQEHTKKPSQKEVAGLEIVASNKDQSREDMRPQTGKSPEDGQDSKPAAQKKNTDSDAETPVAKRKSPKKSWLKRLLD